MIYVGIDDTDMLDTRGTNQLARQLVRRLEGRLQCRMIVRHQLLEDPRVPCTSKNGSASIVFEENAGFSIDGLIEELRAAMRADFVPGSDPGLCVAMHVPADVVDYGCRCKASWIEQDEPRTLARRHGLHLEGLGGDEGGVIGALAAVGLVATGDDGRIVHFASWSGDFSGVHDAEAIRAQDVEIREVDTFRRLTSGRIDVGKRLRPNLRGGAAVLFVAPRDSGWEALRLK